MVKKTPAYKNKLKAMELERNGKITNKRKGNKQMNKYDLPYIVLYWFYVSCVFSRFLYPMIVLSLYHK